jgi:hypothetical protein
VDFGFVEVLIVAVFVLFVIMFVSVVIVMTLAAGRSKKALEGAGLDPLAAEAQPAARAASSQLLAPTRTIEERLRELDDLHARGLISDDEHATARAKALTDG